MRTMRLRPLAPALLAAGALVMAGCGGGGSKGSATGGGASGAEIVPASAPVFISINSDLGSDQWKKARALLNKFPAKANLLERLKASAAKEGVDFDRDVKPALGPEVDVAFLSLQSGSSSPVAITQPKDETKLNAALAKGSNPPQHEKIGDWTVYSDNKNVLESLKAGQKSDKLADDSAFKDAMADLPDDAIAKLYVNGAAVQNALRQNLSQAGGLGRAALKKLDWISAAATAESGGARFQAGLKGAAVSRSDYSSRLVHRLPAGAFVDVSFTNLAQVLGQALKQLETSPALSQQKQQLEQALGFSVENDLLPLFANEGALAVYPPAGGTSGFPTIELVLEEKDQAKAQHVLDRLSALARLSGSLGTVQTVTVAGVTAHELRLSSPPVSIVYAAFDGLLVVTNSKAALAGIKAGGTRLADDPLFKSARSAAKAPDKTAGFVYVNLHAAVPALAGASGASSSTAQNLAPMQSFFGYGSKDGDVTRFSGFLGIK